MKLELIIETLELVYKIRVLNELTSLSVLRERKVKTGN
jgi:hypothetical protein